MQWPLLYYKTWDRIFHVSGQSQCLSIVFTLVKRESGSILGAILTHAGFNFGMGFLIFYAL